MCEKGVKKEKKGEMERVRGKTNVRDGMRELNNEFVRWENVRGK